MTSGNRVIKLIDNNSESIIDFNVDTHLTG